MSKTVSEAYCHSQENIYNSAIKENCVKKIINWEEYLKVIKQKKEINSDEENYIKNLTEAKTFAEMLYKNPETCYFEHTKYLWNIMTECHNLMKINQVYLAYYYNKSIHVHIKIPQTGIQSVIVFRLGPKWPNQRPEFYISVNSLEVPLIDTSSGYIIRDTIRKTICRWNSKYTLKDILKEFIINGLLGPGVEPEGPETD